MVKTVFFHLGSIKTGSTRLQKFCYENHRVLLERDVDYMQFQPPQLELPRWANAEYFLNPKFDTDIVAQYVSNSPASRFLISEEGLLSRPHIWQHQIFQNMRRVVVLYLRNSVELVASWAAENSQPYNFIIAEHLGGRGIVSIDEGIGHWSLEYQGMLFQFMEIVRSDPQLKVVIRPFPPAPQEIGLTEDFLRTLELDEAVAHDLASNTIDETVNVGRTRRYCDAAYYLSKLATEYKVPHLYTLAMVDAIYDRLRSGDDRKVIDTLTTTEMQFIRNRLITPSEALVADFGAPENILKMPKAYDAQNAPYIRIDMTELRQLFFEHVINEQNNILN